MRLLATASRFRTATFIVLSLAMSAGAQAQPAAHDQPPAPEQAASGAASPPAGQSPEPETPAREQEVARAEAQGDPGKPFSEAAEMCKKAQDLAPDAQKGCFEACIRTNECLAENARNPSASKPCQFESGPCSTNLEVARVPAAAGRAVVNQAKGAAARTLKEIAAEMGVPEPLVQVAFNPPTNAKDLRAFNASIDQWSAQMQAANERSYAQFKGFMKRIQENHQAQECFVERSQTLTVQKLKHRAERSCLVEKSLRKRLPPLVPPKWCDSRALRKYLSESLRAMYDGAFEVALVKATQAWLHAPNWENVVELRAMLLSALGQDAEAARLRADIQPFLRALNRQHPERRVSHAAAVRSCVSELQNRPDEAYLYQLEMSQCGDGL